MKLLFFDLETTGVKFWRNGIHQIGGIVDIDGQEAERFDIRLAPNPAATIEQEALDVAGVTLEQVQSYQPMEEGYRQLVGILSQLYKITLTREQLMLISRCVEDISRYAAGDMDLQHTTETLINDMDRTETLGIRSFIVNNSRAIRRRLFPDLEDYEHIGYDGGSKDMINRKRLIGNTYQIYRSILHQLAIDENWNNVYSDMTLPSGDMGTIKVERVDDDKDNDI